MTVTRVEYQLLPIVTVELSFVEGEWKVDRIEADWAGSGAYNTAVVHDGDEERLVEQDGSNPTLVPIEELVDRLNLPKELPVTFRA